jgi:hypothetical protein
VQINGSIFAKIIVEQTRRGSVARNVKRRWRAVFRSPESRTSAENAVNVQQDDDHRGGLARTRSAHDCCIERPEIDFAEIDAALGTH